MNVCKQITADPENALGPSTQEEMADAVITILDNMSTEGVNTLAEKLAEDEMAFDGLLSALSNNQPE